MFSSILYNLRLILRALILMNHLKMKLDSRERGLHLLTFTWFTVRQI